MNIGEIEVGKQYGVLDARYRGIPRQVEVVEIVKVPETIYSRPFATRVSTRNVRKPKVKFLDEPRFEGDAYSQHKIKYAKKGAMLVVEPRQMIDEWNNLSKEVHRRIAREQAENEARAALDTRIKALLPKSLRSSRYEYDRRVSCTAVDLRHGLVVRSDVRLGGKILDRILALAEEGLLREDGND